MDSVSERPLREIALKTGTDKQGVHFYAEAYERHFAPYRDHPIDVLEIGIGGYADPNLGGESLRMWKAFFPRARIVGLDIHDKVGIDEDRIRTVRGDQSDPALVADVVRRFGPFTIVIDDGSHVCRDVITSFVNLFPTLAEDGIYAIEDLQTSYWAKGYGGSSTADRAMTSMTFLQSLADGLNYAEFDIPNYEPTVFDRTITSLAFYHNLAFVQKGTNLGPSNVMPPHPRPRALYAIPAAPARPVGAARRLARRAVPRSVRSAVVRLVRR